MSEAERVARVYRRWRAARGVLVVRFWARPEFWRNMPVAIAAFALLASLYLEAELLWSPPLFRGFATWTGHLRGEWIAALWGVTWLGNLGLFAVLARRLGRDPRSRWVRWGSALPPWSRRLANPWVVAGWGLVLNAMCWLLSALWLVAPDTLDPARWWTAAGFVAVFHAVAAVSLWHVARSTRAEGWWGRALGRGAPLAGLVPAWIGFLWLAGLLASSPSSHRGATCVTAAFSRAGTPGRLPRWGVAMERLGRRWTSLPWWRRLTAPRGASPRSYQDELRARVDLLSVCRVWALLGFFQALLLACVAPAVAVGLGAACLLLLAAGLVRLLWETAARVAALLHLRRLPDAAPVGWSATLEPSAVLAGLALGHLLRDGASPESWVAVGLAGPLLGCLAALWLMVGTVWRPEAPSVRVRRDPRLLWAGCLMLAPPLVGVALAAGGESALQAGRVLRGLGAGAALAQPLLGAWCMPRLLQPFALADLRSKGLAGPLRALLAGLALAALVPLGGLAAPLWIHLRFRLLARPSVAGRAQRFHRTARPAAAPEDR